MKRFFLMLSAACLLAAFGCTAQNESAAAAQKKEYVFKGKVEKVDAANKTLTINGQKVEGWMDAMTMNYVPDKEEVLQKVKPGDEITAKVYEGDYRVLHDVQVVAPAEKK